MAAAGPQYGVATAATKLDCVQIDGLVVLKIIKHCRDEGNPNTIVSGQLLGMDITLEGTTTLEVTSCFPMPQTEGDESADVEIEAYVTEMLRCMREVNVDNNTVGWYMTSHMNSWLDPNGVTVETQYTFQEEMPKSVCLVYDPVRTLSGSVHLKAYRLTDQFMKKYKQHLESDRQGFTEADIKPKFDYNQKMIDEGITIDTIFEEVPVRIHNSALVNAMLYDWACEGTMGSKMHLDFERLDLTNKPFLEKSMELLMDGIENLRNNQESADYKKRNAERMRKDYKRTRGGEDATKEELEAKFPYPSRLQGLLTANQLASHCDAISKFTGQSFSKLYLVKGLQENAQ